MQAALDQQIDQHLQAVHALRTAQNVLQQAAQLIVQAFHRGQRLYVLGNGGSAADAQHIAAELVGRFKRQDKRALPAVALTTDTSCLSAVANDFGFEQVFVRQIDALVQSGDVVWALSVSGRSANVLQAVRQARQLGARIIGFTGQEGTALAALSDVCLMAAHGDSDRVQEIHQLGYHLICGLIEEAFA